MFTSRTHTCELHSYCNELRREEKFPDVIIKVENRTFPCHRIILSSTLEYFRSMFSGNYNETTQKEVEIKGVKADDFELLLTHIYGGSLNLEDDNVFRLLRISNYIGLDTLNNFCEEFILKNKQTIPLNTVIDTFVFASQLGRTVLVNALVERLAQNFSIVSQEEKLLSISSKEIEQILSHVDVVKNRTASLYFLENWCRFHPTEDEFYNNLLAKLNLPQDLCEWVLAKLKKSKMTMLTDEENVNEICNTNRTIGGDKERIFYSDNIDCRESNAVQSDKMKSPIISLYCYGYLPRQSMRDIIGDGARDIPIYSIFQYDFNTLSNRIKVFRKSLSYYNQSVRFFKSVLIDGIQLVFVSSKTYPGTDENTCFDKINLRLYECSESKNYKTLTSYQSSAISKSSHLAVYGTNVYFYNDNEFLVFNAEVDQWTHLKGNEPPLRTRNANMISYQNNLYVIGGQNIETSAETISTSNGPKKFNVLENGKIFQRYDPREGTWSRLPYMTHGHSSFSCCVHEDILYATGGESLSYFKGLVECYDFKACKWRVFEKGMPKPKQNHIVYGNNDQLYFFGGDKDLTWFWYDLKEDIWSRIYSIPKEYNSERLFSILDVEVKK